MTSPVLREDLLAELRRLDNKADSIRKELGLADRNELVWESMTDVDRCTVVEADGYGGAAVRDCKNMGGNERLVYREQKFHNMADAIELAETWQGDEG